MTDYRPRPSWQRDEDESGSVIAAVFLIWMGIAIGASLVYGGYKLATPSKPADLDCRQCHGKIAAYTDYFRKAGSKQPERMAEAVLSTRNPRLMAAIAKIETSGNPEVRRAGYRKQHDGAYQVNPKHWGRVPNDAVDQALQAEAILDELTSSRTLKKALAVYGGDSTDKYSRKVLAELQGVPR